ncbi:MAG: 6-carboxytetrahydropterin synthase QueD [Bryobacterales bacterium]|nr:6-carboxytetrahydropterin synthase QueD [Bryobacterales bacterium]MBV9398703.1 6-carboxytetrahydropterin synthase QueD [Bryobacterales bacterium]
MFEVSVEQTFAAGHALRNYKGACENVHGHNFKVQVTIEGARLDDTGMLVDFLDLKQSMRDVISRLDHVFLNDISPFDVKNPSAENIAEYFFQELDRRLAKNPVPVQIREVRVWETEIQSAAYRR